MKTLATTLSVLIPIFFTSCDEDFICKKANGYVETQVFDLSAIDKLSMELSGHVFITIGQEQAITVEAQREILDHLNTAVRSGAWNISLDQCFRRYSAVNIYVTVPSLEYVGLSGSGTITSSSTIVANDFKTSLSGSGTIDLTVEANNVDTYLSGSGSINLSGSTDQHDMLISGSGNANTFGLTSNRANVRISGSGNAYISVKNELDVNISGSGNVIYDGNPTITAVISGSGQVRKRN